MNEFCLLEKQGDVEARVGMRITKILGMTNLNTDYLRGPFYF